MVSRFERSKQEEAYEAQIATQSDALKRWLENKHPEIKYGEAVLKAFMEDMGGSFLYATDDDFEYSLSTTRTKFSRRRIPTEKEVKADLIDEISSLIASKNNGRDGKFSTFRNGVEPSELDKERTRMSFWDVPKLTERLQEVVRKQTLNAKPIHELQQQVRNHYAVQNQRPALPAEYTTERIKDRSFPVPELKRLILMYGLTTVNDRIFGRN